MGQGLHRGARTTEAVRRAHPRLTQPLPPSCKGFRGLHCQRRMLDHDGQRQTPFATDRERLNNLCNSKSDAQEWCR